MASRRVRCSTVAWASSTPKGIFRAVDMMAHLLKGSTVMASSEAGVTWSLWNASWCLDVQEAERTFPFLPALDVAYTAYLRFKDEASDLRLKGLSDYSPAQVFFATFCHGTCQCGLFQEEEFGDVQ
ncbi:hypothetical protein HPB51_019917 [Rhipicephalus microplus]|uniref:Uncharacterized protein n=1 Tax=Rhipicephalus microplus TaxID=6941 RepID=A0A9J6E2Y9_RHIMP|nr:hypothetical protein HPB51_019917 [Rhipicephalus microplus]